MSAIPQATNTAGPSVSLRLGRSRNLHSASCASQKQAQSSQNQRATDYFGVENAGTKNVVVLGGSYGGMHAATVLAQKLPPSHRVILVERNSHFNHLYVFPRFSVLPGHEHKAFIPYTSIFGSAPKRKSHAHLKRQQAASQTTRSTASTQTRNAQGILEMGGADQARPPPSSDAKGSANGLTPHAESSRYASNVNLRPVSPSRSDDLFSSDEEPSASRSQNSRSSSAATSSRDSRSDATNATSWTSADEQVEPDAGNKKMEAALVEDGTSRARQEEELGRPPMQVTELGEAMEEGLDLDGNTDAAAASPESEQDIAEGFEDAAPHVVLQATVTSITDTHVIVTPTTSSASQPSATSSKLWSIDSLSIPYTHLVYALGSHLPDPLRTVAKTKPEGMAWMTNAQAQIKDAKRIVLVGGGALGVEFATDIKSIYPDKDVTLIHSRQRLLPNFDERIHEIAKARLEELGVNMVLGERLALTEGCPKGSTTALDPEPEPPVMDGMDGASSSSSGSGRPRPIRRPSDALHSGLKRVRTTGGKEFICDLLMLCTGQQPNSGLMASLSPTSVDPHTRLVRVHPTLQVAVPQPEDAAPGPFDARPPCGDCDCFLDKKAAGANLDDRQQDHLDEHGNPTAPHHQSRIPNVYAIGDCADAFGSLNAGYQAWGMADIAAENIIRDIGTSSDPQARGDDAGAPGSPALRAEPAEMMHFTPAPNMLKLSLGVGKMVFQGAPIAHKETDGTEAMRPEISMKEDPEDLGVQGVWTFMAGADTSDLYV